MVDTGLALVPIEEMTIKDTWYMTGMAGTHSDTIATRDHRILRMSQFLNRESLSEYKDEVEYRTCNKVALQVMTVPPVLGIAQAALDETLERVRPTLERVSRTATSPTVVPFRGLSRTSPRPLS